jgi:hypothetical protein
MFHAIIPHEIKNYKIIYEVLITELNRNYEEK